MTQEKTKQERFISLAMPLMLQSLTAAVVSATDALMLGVLGQESLAAVTLAGQYIQIFVFFLTALCVGSTALLSQYYGNRDQESVRKVLNITLQISLTLGMLVSLSVILIPNLIMAVFTNDPVLIGIGAGYLRISCLTPFFMSFSMVYTNFMKNTGLAKKSSFYGILAVGLNVILNLIFIYGFLGAPAMGAKGAGLATVLARFVEFVLFFIAARGSKYVPFKLKGLCCYYRALMRKYIRYTLPSVIQLGSWMTASSLAVAILGHQSSDVVAASAVALIVYNIASGPVNGYASAAGILTGQMMGRGEMEKARKTGDRLMKGTVGLSLGMGVLVAFLCPFICAQYTHMTVAAQGYLKVMVYLAGLRCLAKYINTTLAQGLFTAGGDIQYLMKLDIINMWCVVLPMGLLAGYVLHLPPLLVYVILNMDEFYKLFFMIRHYRKYLWVRNLTKKEWAPAGRYEDLIRRRIFEEMPLGVMMIGASGRISLVNEACAGILGRKLEEIEGSLYTELFVEDVQNEAFGDAVLEAVTDKNQTHASVVDYKIHEMVHKLDIRSSFIEDEDSKMGVCLMIREIG